MNWCKPHWDQLRQAIKDKGLDKFGAQTGEAAAKQMADELEGREHAFDPLMASWNHLNAYMAESLKRQGRGMELLQLRCPMCILVEDGQPELVDRWINGCTDDALSYAIKKGLIKEH
jgi:hypothetical protein